MVQSTNTSCKFESYLDFFIKGRLTKMIEKSNKAALKHIVRDAYSFQPSSSVGEEQLYSL